jgi:predicted glycosyltransferase
MDAKLSQILVVASTAYRPDWHTALNFIVSGPAGGLGMLGDALIEYFKSHKKHLKELKDALDGSKKTFDQDPSQENLQAIKNHIDEIKEEVDGMPADSNLDALKKEFDAVTVNSQKTLDQAKKKYANLATSNPNVTTTAPMQTAQTSQQASAIKQTDDLVAKIKLSAKMDENTKERLITWLSPFRGALNDAKTAPAAAQKIDAAEKKWIAEGMI